MDGMVKKRRNKRAIFVGGKDRSLVGETWVIE